LRSQLKAGGSYLVKNRYKPWLEVIYTGKRDALIYQTGSPYLVQTLKSYVDINLGMEYLYNENLSGFLRITNLLNKRYELFYQHPNYGIELMIGIGYKF
jgi:outer membrane cobalamin receptor